VRLRRRLSVHSLLTFVIGMPVIYIRLMVLVLMNLSLMIHSLTTMVSDLWRYLELVRDKRLALTVLMMASHFFNLV
jgi:hypothetical protein